MFLEYLKSSPPKEVLALVPTPPVADLEPPNNMEVIISTVTVAILLFLIALIVILLRRFLPPGYCLACLRRSREVVAVHLHPEMSRSEDSTLY